MEAIRKAAVIGAGVMGAGIAAQLANAGVPVLLLDIVPAGASNRNVLAETAISNMLKTDPAPFMSARAAKWVTAGNVEDHLAQISDCDWIIEAVTEVLDVKQALYRKIDALVERGGRGARLADLLAGIERIALRRREKQPAQGFGRIRDAPRQHRGKHQEYPQAACHDLPFPGSIVSQDRSH